MTVEVKVDVSVRIIDAPFGAVVLMRNCLRVVTQRLVM